jgi:hypothetical protein
MDESNFYEIRVKGHLDDTWADWFEGITVSNEEGGEAILSGSIPDQAALQGILNRISSLGMVLISVNPVREGDEYSPATPPDQERDTASTAGDQDSDQ